MKSSIAEKFTEAINTLRSKPFLKQVTATPLYSNAFYLIFDTVITSIGGFFFWMVVARFYSETEVGYGSAIISATNLLSALSVVGMGYAIVRFLSQTGDPRKLINSVFTVSGLLSLALAAIFVAGLDVWSPVLQFIRLNAIFLIVFLAMVLISTLSILTDSVFVAQRKARFVLFKSAIFSLLKIPLPIAFAFFLHTFGVVASWCIALGVALAISLFLFLPNIEAHYKPLPTLSLSQLRGIWRYSSVSYVASILGLLPRTILPLMVVNILGTKDNAYFYVAWMLASLLFAIPASVSRSLFAEGSYSARDVRHNVTRAIKFVFLLIVPALAVMVICAKWFLLAFGEGYASALQLVWLLALSSLPIAITSVYFSILRVHDRLIELAVIEGFIVAATLLLSFLLMPTLGIMGIGCVWLGVHCVAAIATGFRLRAWTRQFGRTVA